jgi:hypothetical protein
MVHEVFGYQLDRMKDVTVRFETTDESTTVINHGPPKPMNPIIKQLIGIRKRHVFNDVWTTYFSPVYSVYDHRWVDPATGNEALVKWRVYIFFTPVDENETRVTSFTYAKSRWPFLWHRGLGFCYWLMRHKVNREIQLDVDILDGLASKDPGIEGMKLSRFDKVLGLNRERINRVYRGDHPETEPLLKIATG